MTRRRLSILGCLVPGALLATGCGGDVCGAGDDPAVLVRVELSPGDDVTGLARVYWRAEAELAWTECSNAMNPVPTPHSCARGIPGTLVVRAEYQELGDPFAAEAIVEVEDGRCTVRTEEITLVLSE